MMKFELKTIFIPDNTFKKQNTAFSIQHIDESCKYSVWDIGQHRFRQWLLAWWRQAIIWNNVGLSSNWSIRSCGIYLSGLSWKIWRYQSVRWDWNLICRDNFIPSPEIIHLFSSDNSFICVMVVCWQLLSQSLIPLVSVYSRGTRYPPHSLLWPHHRGPMSQELKRQTCCMRSQPHERLWPPLLKLNLEMVGKLVVSAAVAVAKS